MDNILNALNGVNQANESLKIANRSYDIFTPAYRRGDITDAQYLQVRKEMQDALLNWEVSAQALEHAIDAAPNVEPEPSSQGNLF